MHHDTDLKTKRIAALNDTHRTALFGRWIMTRGIAELPESDREAIMRKIMDFDDFTPDNDPYGEHDFGQIEHSGHKVFWKIDYYAKGDFTRGSDAPESAAATDRVMTIMLADEY